MDQAESESPCDDIAPVFLEVHHRPNGNLRKLIPEMQWEVTRRHPLYIQLWETARKYFGNTLELSEEDSFAAEIAHLQLKLIGFPGQPRPPSVEFDSLDETPLPASLRAGAVRPLTMRDAVALLAGNASKNVLQYAGTLLYQASLDDEGEPSKLNVLRQLEKVELAGIDDYLDVPVFTINTKASNAQISKDLASLLEGFRGSEPTPRSRPDKHAEYLRVWDMREGWTAGEYHGSREMYVHEIAKRLGEFESTVSNQYRCAFELIIGHEYTPDRWRASMGPIKFKAQFPNLLNSDVVGRVSRRRPLKSPTRRPVPESVITPGSLDCDKGLVASLAVSGDGLPFHQLFEAVGALVNSGASDERIAEELGKTPEEIGDFADLRAFFTQVR
jgi:hypothetical protein